MYKGIIKRWVQCTNTGILDDEFSDLRKTYKQLQELLEEIKHVMPKSDRYEALRVCIRNTRRSMREPRLITYCFILTNSVPLHFGTYRPAMERILHLIVNCVQRHRAIRKPPFEDTTPGRMLRKLKAIKKSILAESKTPKTPERHIGIEIEFLSPMERREIEELLIEAKLEHICTIKDDGSVDDPASNCDGSDCECNACLDGQCCGVCSDGGDNGHEITVLTTEKEYRKVLKRVSEVLKEAHAWVNSSCGLHVHLDARERSYNLTYESLVWALPALCKVVPKSRLQNRYCRINRPMERCVDRYYAINAKSYNQHSTIEVRLHSGTTDPRKISHWIATLIRLCDGRVYKYLDNPQPTTVGALKRFLPKQTYRYLVNRQRQFSHDTVEETI